MSDLISRKALLELIDENYKAHWHYETVEEVFKLITNAPAVQRKGWVNVPIEPTHEMITRAFHLAQNPNMLIKDMYKAMVQMAPTDRE